MARRIAYGLVTILLAACTATVAAEFLRLAVPALSSTRFLAPLARPELTVRGLDLVFAGVDATIRFTLNAFTFAGAAAGFLWAIRSF